ncbi:MAG TPA: hypothetical protein VG225_01055 [Terracidiphilus sp.]|jgi:hypothetical protein|nr:hypothetical protein [Terracidiphilus sp.]
MKKLLGICAVVFLALGDALFPATASAATDVTGAWTADMQSPDGNTMQLTFTFKQDGAKLTGSVQGPQGDPIDIQNGKVDGDKIYWETSFNGMTIQHDGTVNGDEMKVSIKSSDGQFPAMDITLKRAKP